MMRTLRTRRPARFVAIAFVALLTLVAPVDSSRFAAAQQDELVGDFTVAIGSETIPTDIANGSALIGRWHLSFEPDGSYQAERIDVGVVVRGTYEINGDSVTVTDQEGLLSCSNPALATADEGDVSSGTYRFRIRSNSLTFTLVEDGCALRRVLYTTADFQPFVACVTQPMTDLAAAPSDAPRAGDSTAREILAIAATPAAEEDVAGTPAAGTPEEQIDDLLAQMTACWATGDPSRFIPLWSTAFREQFLQDPTALDSLRLAMQVPLTWERAGDVRMRGDTEAVAVVRTTTLGEEEFVRYRFVFEDGEWRWDGTDS